MFCPECGNQNPDTARFCMKCGYSYSQPTSFASAPPVSPPRQSVAPANPKKSASVAGVLLLLGFFAIVAIVGIVAFAGFNFIQHQQSSTNYDRTSYNSYSNTSSQPSYSTQTDTSTRESEPQSRQIVNQAFTLEAGQYMSYKFTIPKSSSGGTVSGNFVASGGSNDIYVVITNETGVTNIKNGNSYKAYYNSGKVTTDDLNVNLSPGTYYIVFSNIHSMMTPKAVNADINVAY